MRAMLGPRQRRAILFAALYFSEGAPIGFVWWALPTRLHLAGVAVDRITALTSLLVLPWALKLLWAPAVDRLRGRRFGLRAWIGCAQLAMAATLVPLLWLDVVADFPLVYGLLIAHALAAATQDVSVDALCMASVPEVERGRMNGWMQAGMLAGRGIFGGLSLLVAARLGWPVVIAALIACVLGSLALLATTPRGCLAEPPSGREAGVGLAIGAAIRRSRTWLALIFAAVAGAAFEGAGAVAGPFLTDHGAAEQTIGLFFAAVAVGAMLLGAVGGGFFADRRGPGRAIGAGQLAICAAVLGLAAIDFAGGGAGSSLAAMTVLYAGIGLYTASSYTLLMNVADGAARATMFSAFMGATNLCELGSTRAVGWMQARGGYATAFVVLVAVAAIATLTVPSLARRPRAT